jgi:hypothetical protein
MQRLWDSRRYTRLVEELTAQRVEGLAAGELASRASVAAAAWSLIRLEELNQPQAQLGRTLIRAILACQEADGGWGDVAVTALCLRALSLWQGQGNAIERGLNYLAQLQQPEGIWPKIPIRRMAADPLVSAFVMLQLSDHEGFRAAVDFNAAVNWFRTHAPEMDAAARTLWAHARPRGSFAVQGTLFQTAN